VDVEDVLLGNSEYSVRVMGLVSFFTALKYVIVTWTNLVKIG